MNPNTVINQGQSVQVADLAGETTEVKVRLLRINEFPEYFRLADDEEALAAFVTGADPQWISNLTTESVLGVCESAHDLNFQNACRWAARRARFSEGLLPVAEKGMRMRQALESFAPVAPSPSAKP